MSSMMACGMRVGQDVLLLVSVNTHCVILEYRGMLNVNLQTHRFRVFHGGLSNMILVSHI